MLFSLVIHLLWNYFKHTSHWSIYVHHSSHGTHRAITIARTVTGHRLKGPVKRPVGDRVPPRDRTVQHTTHYIMQHCFIWLIPFTSSLFKPTMTTRAAGGGRGVRVWPALHVIPLPRQGRVPSTEVCGCKVDPRQSTEFDQKSTSSDNSNTQYWVCSEATSECYHLVTIVQTCLIKW